MCIDVFIEILIRLYIPGFRIHAIAMEVGGCGAGLSKTIEIRKISSLGLDLDLVLVRIDLLKPHEQIIVDHLNEIIRSIREKGYNGPPIIVERDHYIILDGHHRVNALKELQARWVPAILISYQSNLLTLTSWRHGVNVSQHEVVRRALSGELYPPKTTRHIIHVKLPVIKASLGDLKTGSIRGVSFE